MQVYLKLNCQKMETAGGACQPRPLVFDSVNISSRPIIKLANSKFQGSKFLQNGYWIFVISKLLSTNNF